LGGRSPNKVEGFTPQMEFSTVAIVEIQFKKE
jgi:hypothetical protein